MNDREMRDLCISCGGRNASQFDDEPVATYEYEDDNSMVFHAMKGDKYQLYITPHYTSPRIVYFEGDVIDVLKTIALGYLMRGQIVQFDLHKKGRFLWSISKARNSGKWLVREGHGKPVVTMTRLELVGFFAGKP